MTTVTALTLLSCSQRSPAGKAPAPRLPSRVAPFVTVTTSHPHLSCPGSSAALLTASNPKPHEGPSSFPFFLCLVLVHRPHHVSLPLGRRFFKFVVTVCKVSQFRGELSSCAFFVTFLSLFRQRCLPIDAVGVCTVLRSHLSPGSALPLTEPFSNWVMPPPLFFSWSSRAALVSQVYLPWPN